MQTLMQAIAHEEGFYVPCSRASRNNNPGNLNFEPWQKAMGAVLEAGSDARFARFPDSGTGFAAMRQLLTKDYAGMTLADALAKWAPPTDGNNVSSYLANVMEWTGMQADTVLTADLIG